MVLVYHQFLLMSDVVKTCPSLKPIFAVRIVRKYWILDLPLNNITLWGRKEA